MKEVIILKANSVEKIETKWGNLTWYASKKLGNSTKMTTGTCVIKPGRENPFHKHSNCYEVLTVIKGEILHYLDGQKAIKMKPGDTISIPPNLAHKAKNTGKSNAIMFIAFNSGKRKMEIISN
ncbi:MAG TPA: cupin domain-containing protein [Victivallales bacterium]|nr:cupin domain-containing protein [Victivallales bacterium]HRR06328.1 cupin domain-containing protein [Victivallales bacterium]HRR28970.1 cupin domain-containing protein [Victivallales bacterium]